MSLKVTGRGGLELDKSSESKDYRSDFYEGKKGYDLDDLNKDIPKFFEEKDIYGVQVIMEINNPELQHTTHVSKFFSEDKFYEMEYEDMEEYFEDEIFGLSQYGGYAPGAISVRVMYHK